jgi:hypothetical protein
MKNPSLEKKNSKSPLNEDRNWSRLCYKPGNLRNFVTDKCAHMLYNKITIQFKIKRRDRMNSVMKFLASGTGRIVRIVVGVVLVVLGFFINPTWLGIILVVIGLVPLLAGIFDVCVFAPLFKLPFSGKKIRAG